MQQKNHFGIFITLSGNLTRYSKYIDFPSSIWYNNTIKRTSGEILYNGEEITALGSKYRQKVGYTPQLQGMYEDFSARAFLHYIGSLKGMKLREFQAQTEEFLEVVGLNKAAHKRLGSFSGGMRQRVLIAAAMLDHPEILILDEPTAGLDPEERIQLRSYISDAARNRTVILATHVVSDIESIADSVIMLCKGKPAAVGTPTQLIAGVRITEKLRGEMAAEYDRTESEQKTLYEEYMAELASNENTFNDELIKKYNRLVDMGEQLLTLETFIEKADTALAYTDRTGIKTALIKPKTYELLLVRDTATTNKNALYIMLAVVGIFGGICANENRCNMNAAQKSSLRGRGRLTAIKLSIIGISSVLITALIYASQLIMIGAGGYNDLGASAQSLEFLRFVPFETSILGYIVIMFAVRMISTFAVGAFVMLISRYCKNIITAVCISAVVFIVPAALSGTGLVSVPSAADFVGFSVFA